MERLKGYRTIVVMGLGVLFAVLASQGWIVPESDQAAIQAGILSVAGLVMRYLTDGPVGKHQ